ncbi:UNVERIFIED_CONTAM: Ferruginol synthase [Sesamum radiatum]|uniref:Ferruginol synthase n=1 Tax=Sesamum radiatum TaxID=300843 RepID=A0AAW2MF44_SESRA
MDYFTIFFLVFLGFWTWLLFLRVRRSPKLPPGPYPFPIVGNILQLGQCPHQTLAKLSKTYGPLMSLQLGTVYTVVASSPEIAREILKTHDQVFSSRAIPIAGQTFDHHKISIAFLPAGPEWRKIRKLSREQIFSTPSLEASQELRQDKLLKLCAYLEKCADSGRLTDMGQALFITTVNLMSATLFSSEVTDFDSDSAQDFKKSFDTLQNVIGAPNLADFFPILKPFDPQGIQKKAEFYFAKVLGFLEDVINQRLEARENNAPKKKDMLETFLDVREASDEYEFLKSTNEIKHLLMDLFVAGSDTTASTTEWALTELILHPEVMWKAKQELKALLGEKKLVQEADIAKLPYLQAVIKESLRIHPPGPLLVPRKSEAEVEISGYTIPKGTQIFVNVWAMGRDSTLWSNPDAFQPERFLDSTIDYKGQDYELVPFGSGRRICPGMPLANRMLHVTMATLIHNFDWKLEPGKKLESLYCKELFGIALRRAVPLKVIPVKCGT